MEAVITPPLRRVAKPKNNATTQYITLDNGEHHIMKAVPGYDNVWVNDSGEIVTNNGRVIKQHSLNIRNNKPFKCVRIKQVTTYVHKLVCLAFHGVSDKRFSIHLDANTTNNHYRNLAWATGIEKHMNQVSSGAFQQGVEANSKIKIESIPDIQERLKAGQTLRKIAIAYNVSEMSVHRYIKRHNL